MLKSNLLLFSLIGMLLFSLTAWIFQGSNIKKGNSELKNEFYSEHLKKYESIFNDGKYITSNQYKIDILHYDLFFDLFPDKKEFTASAIISGVVKEDGVKSLDLNFYDNFEIQDVKFNDVDKDYLNEDKLLTIFSDSSFPLDTFKIKITYSGTPKRAGFAGFAFGKINGTSLVYTLSEPVYASSWFPCNDFPSDKALLDIRIKNDSSQVSISNGKLIEVKTDGDRKTYHWKSIYPISTYLIAVYSSSYLLFSDEYISLDKQDTMGIDYYVLEDNLKDAKIDFAEHSEIMKFFAETFGEYPFIKEKYGVAEFLWQMGAMEHQTITGTASNIIGGRNFFLDIYIHELAHQWWGNAVGPKSWNDIWLNEGFSTYCEALYFEFKSGKTALQSTMINKRQAQFSIPLNKPGAFLFNATVYDKGAWVLHMLRWELGDSTFFNVLREYYEKFKYSNASTDDFKLVCEAISGKDLTQFFDQWINGTGKIELNYNWESIKSDDEFVTKIRIKQVQDEYEEYSFPLEIAIKNELNESEYYKFNIESKSVQFTIKDSVKTKEVILDPNNWILMTSKKVE